MVFAAGCQPFSAKASVPFPILAFLTALVLAHPHVSHLSGRVSVGYFFQCANLGSKSER